MRVSEKMVFNNVANRLQQQAASLLKLQEQVTSGKRVGKPSDDPIVQAEIINFEKSLESTTQYLKNIDRLESFMSASETVIQTVQDQLTRARELAIQGANATNTASDRLSIAQEVRQIYDQLIAVGNTNHAGAYIFAGNEVNTEPFVNKGRYVGGTIAPSGGSPIVLTGGNNTLTLSIDGVSSTLILTTGNYTTGAALATEIQTQIDASTDFQTAGVGATVTFESTPTNHLLVTSNAIGGTSAVTPSGTAATPLGLSGGGGGVAQAAGTYLGDSAENSILIGKNSTIVKNIPGDRFLTGAGGGVNVLAVLASLQSALETNSVSGIQTALGNFNGAQDQVSNERSLLGARLNRAETATSTLQDFKFTVTRLKSEREDIDLPSAISDLLLQESMLEATRATAARIVQRSLLDFLR